MIFASFMLLAVFAGVVSAQGFLSAITDPVVGMFNDWSAGNGYSFGVAKLFVLVIVWILLAGVLGKFPGLSGDERGKGLMRFFLSFAIAFLATAYFTETELAIIISSYSAMGFVLGGIVPFLIMVFFTSSVIGSIGRGGSKTQKTWVLRGLWAVFGGFFLYKVLSVGGASASDFIVYGHWIFVGLSVLVIFMLPFLVRKAVKEETRELYNLAEEDARSRGELLAKKAADIAKMREKIDKAKYVAKSP